MTPWSLEVHVPWERGEPSPQSIVGAGPEAGSGLHPCGAGTTSPANTEPSTAGLAACAAGPPRRAAALAARTVTVALALFLWV